MPATTRAPTGTYQDGQPVTSATVEEISVNQPTEPVSQFTASQAPASTYQEVHPATQHSVSGEMPVLKPVRPTNQTTVTQPCTGISDKTLSSTSYAGAAFSVYRL